MSFVTLAQFRHSAILQYFQSVAHLEGRTSFTPKNFEQLQGSKNYDGKVSKAVAKRIQRAISHLLDLSPARKIFNPVSRRHIRFQLAFITLTFPDYCAELDQKFLHKEVFLKWLREAQRNGMIRDYIWKAELQANGTLHYHLTSNRFILYDRLRNSWNRWTNEAGLLEQFYRQYGHRNPNSTDIHQVLNIKRLPKYLAKYMCKEQPDGARLKIKTWDCSKRLKAVGYFTDVLTAVQENILHHQVEHGVLERFESDKCVIYNAPPHHILAIMTDRQRNDKRYMLENSRLPEHFSPGPKKVEPSKSTTAKHSRVGQTMDLFRKTGGT